MLVEQRSFLDFLGMEGSLYRIPAYQRIYSWRDSQCEELWLDILRAGRGKRNHFLGTILYIASDKNGDEATYEIIDGQQRMTSLSLILLALARFAESNPDSGIYADEIFDRYLRPAGEDGKSHLKFTPSSHDVEAYLDVLNRKQSEISACPSDGAAKSTSAIKNNMYYFESLMQIDDFVLEELISGLRNLQIIVVEVDDPGQAQDIFEGINSKGMPLNVADMVRNYLLLAENHDEQTRLYETYWKPSQEMFAPDPGSLRMNGGIKSWLSIRLKNARILSPDQVYSSFKRYVEDEYRGDKEPILRELRGFCLMWAENYRYHGTKKYKSGSDWAELGAPALTANYKLKKADNEEYAQHVREELKKVDTHW